VSNIPPRRAEEEEVEKSFVVVEEEEEVTAALLLFVDVVEPHFTPPFVETPKFFLESPPIPYDPGPGAFVVGTRLEATSRRALPKVLVRNLEMLIPRERRAASVVDWRHGQGSCPQEGHEPSS
jgi:hypothetical protein